MHFPVKQKCMKRAARRVGAIHAQLAQAGHLAAKWPRASRQTDDGRFARFFGIQSSAYRPACPSQIFASD